MSSGPTAARKSPADPFFATLAGACDDDELLSDADREAIAAARQEYRRGDTLSTEALLAELGLDDSCD